MFPSYPLMKKCYNNWYKLFAKPSVMEGDKTTGTIEDYERFCNQKKGGILFCVHRANYSEGHNFSGRLCNGVIMIGVPNQFINDPKLLLKKELYKNPKIMSMRSETNTYKNYYYR